MRAQMSERRRNSYHLKEISTVVIFIFWSIGGTIGLDNGLALTPPMGFNTWERFRCTVNCKHFPRSCIGEELVKRTADIMSGEYLAAGYKYLVLDDCWLAHGRDKYGNLAENMTRFPLGMKSLVRYVQSTGLKFGIYGNLGRTTCAGYPGISEDLQKDAILFAKKWKVDFVKLDGCYSNPEQHDFGYPEFGKILNKTGRPIVYSCSWPYYANALGISPKYEAVMKHCNLWRNYNDIQDSWENVVSIITYYAENQEILAKYHGPGHWNDADMLNIGNFGLSFEQAKSQMAIWCVLGVPLFISTDLAEIEPQLKAILLNKVAIEINQDPLGQMGRRIFNSQGINIWRKQILPKFHEYYSYGVVLLNLRQDGAPKQIMHSMAALGMYNPYGYLVHDVFGGVSCQVPKQGLFHAMVPPSGSVFWRVTVLNASDSSAEFCIQRSRQEKEINIRMGPYNVYAGNLIYATAVLTTFLLVMKFMKIRWARAFVHVFKA